MEQERLVGVALTVSDLAVSAAFYRSVLDQNNEVQDEPGHRSWIRRPAVEILWIEGARLRLTLIQGEAGEELTKHAELAFLIDDLEAMHESLVAAGIPVVHAPRPWNDAGGSVARYLDPDGNIVSFVRIAW